MPATVSHVLSATTPDDPAYEIRPSHWNSAHAFTFNAVGSEISGAFSNQPGGVTFGLETNGFITAGAPAGGGGITAINVSAGALSQNLSALTFNNANGVSFGLAASVITASHNGLTTARASNDGIGLNTAQTNVTWTVNSSGLSLNAGGYAGTGFTSTTTAGTAIVGTHNTAGLSIGVPLYLTTAQPVGAYLTTARASNDAVGLNTALTAGPLAWTVNSSGISLNAGSAAGTTSGFAGNLISGSMTHNTAGLNLSLNHPAWLTTARASNDAVGLNTAQSNVTWTVNSSGISLDARGYAGTGTTFNGTNASASITQNSAGIRLDLSVAAGGGGLTPVASASNGSFSFTTLAFSNANNVTFGTSAGSIITASVAAPGAAAENNWFALTGNTAGNTTASGSTIALEGGNNITLSGTNGSVIRIDAPASSSLVGGNGISISTAGSTITLMDEYESYWQNANYVQGTTAQTVGRSTSVVFPMLVDHYLSLDRIRMWHTVSLASTSFASTANTTYSYNQAETHNLVFYTKGTGASSLSLQSIGSTSGSVRYSINCAQNSTNNISVTHGITFPMSTGTSSLSFSYAATNSTMQVSTTHMTALSGMKLWDTAFASTLPEGMVWLAYGISTAQTTQGTANLSAGRLLHSHVGVSQPNNTFGEFGAANNASVQLMYGLGSFSTNAIATTASLGLSNISSSASHVLPLITLMRIA